MKYKAGDKVRVVSNTRNPEIEYKNELVGKVCEINQCVNAGGYYWIWNMDKSDYWSFNESDLTPVEKTLYTLEVGDVVVDSNGYEHEVIEVLTQSCMTTYKGVNTNWFTFKQIEEKGWKVKSPQPTPLKMTVSEIAEKLGHEVEIIK